MIKDVDDPRHAVKMFYVGKPLRTRCNGGVGCAHNKSRSQVCGHTHEPATKPPRARDDTDEKTSEGHKTDNSKGTPTLRPTPGQDSGATLDPNEHLEYLGDIEVLK